jgi:hypothetical protein
MPGVSWKRSSEVAAGMTRILMFGCKDPFEVVSPPETLERGLMRGNSGNLLFSHAAFRTLSTPGTEITVSDFTDLYDRAGWIDEHFDRVVLPFANAFRPEFRSRLERLTDLVERLTIPVSVLGVGAQSTSDLSLEPLAGVAPTVTRFMRAVLAKSPSVGVRGEFSATFLRSLGFADVEVIGCPSMFLRGAELSVREPGELGASSRIGLTASRVDPPEIGELLTRARAEHPEVVYLAQGTVDLDLMLWGEPRGAAEGDTGVPKHLGHQLFREDKVRLFVDASTWLEHMSGLDFCFGTRIHGSVAAILGGTPGHVVAHDSRTLELSRYFEIPHTHLHDLTSTTTPRSLAEGSDYGPLVANHAERFARFASYLDRHQLAHVHHDPEAGAAFDKRLAEVTFPAGVRALTSEDNLELASRVRWLRREQLQQQRRAQRRLSRLEQRVRTLERPRPAPATPTASGGHPATSLRARAGRLRRRLAGS